MDKSFNDQELSDIMKETEALEEEFSGNEKSEETDESDTTSVLEALAEMEEEQSIPLSKSEESVLPFETKASAPTSKKCQSSMMFKVAGDMNIELQLEIGGKTVMLDVSETGLTIHMEGGITFSVPVSDAHSLKKAV